MPNDLAYDLTPEDRCPDPLPDAPAGEFEYCELQQVAYDLLWRAHHYRRKKEAAAARAVLEIVRELFRAHRTRAHRARQRAA